MKVSRRQFGITLISGVLAVFLSRFLGIFSKSFWGRDKDSKSSEYKDAPVARYWRRGDHLAG